jgi:hypothetical protein
LHVHPTYYWWTGGIVLRDGPITTHVDLDYSKCISIWTVEPGKELKTKGWYFILPYLTCNVDKKDFAGMAVKLRHGAGIEWDGRHVFQCSTSPKGKTINVQGTFFGITHI